MTLELSVEELALALGQEEDSIILDVRETWEYATAHIEGSILIPLGSLPQLAGTIKASGNIYVLCHHGRRSLQATEWLRANGFVRAYSIRGGIEQWAAKIDNTIARY